MLLMMVRKLLVVWALGYSCLIAHGRLVQVEPLSTPTEVKKILTGDKKQISFILSIFEKDLKA